MNIDYQQFLDEALRGAIKKILAKVQNDGLPKRHHFYVSFKTTYSGVILSPLIRAQYPHEITIVLQNQFENLTVLDDSFTVRLSFNGIQEQVTVPFDSIISFFDPSVDFTLQFSAREYINITDKAPQNRSEQKNKKQTIPHKSAKDNIIILDNFRNKGKT
jgi:uncharacterized protein